MVFQYNTYKLYRPFTVQIEIHIGLLLFLLLLAAMTYNQVQLFQINAYANHYEDIEITRYRAIYGKSIAGRGIARLIRLD